MAEEPKGEGGGREGGDAEEEASVASSVTFRRDEGLCTSTVTRSGRCHLPRGCAWGAGVVCAEDREDDGPRMVRLRVGAFRAHI